LPHQFIIPALEARGFSFLKTEEVENKFLQIVNKDKGDFEDGSLANVLESFNKSGPVYLFLHYLDDGKMEHRCTIKIRFGLFGGPYKVEYCPAL